MHHGPAAFPAAHPRTSWRVASVLLASLLVADACTTDTGGSRSPATTSPPRGAPAATATNAPTPSPARNLRGLIAYSTQAGDIWVMDADGSNRRQVTRTRDPAFDLDPSLSPDGRRLVFRTSRGQYLPDPNGTGVQGVFVINLDGSDERQIQPPRGGRFPDWYLMNPDATGVHSLPQLQGAGDPIDWLAGAG